MPAGRPAKIDTDILNKLEEMFLIGSTDAEACFYAGISHQTLYDYCKRNPEYTERKELLKRQPLIRAKKNIVEALNSELKTSLETSRWYLERKCKDEFSTRQETTGKDGKDLFSVPDLEDIQEVINKLNG